MSQKNGCGSLVAGHLIAFVFCVAFPGFVTAVAPVSWITFEREAGVVSATARICFFFVIPYSTRTVAPVIGVGDHFVAGTVERRAGGRRDTRSEDEAYLEIHGADKTVAVPVTPFNIKSVTQRAQGFLSDASAAELRMTVVANWKFSVLVGGLVSLLTVAYLIGILLTSCRYLLRLSGFGPEEQSRPM